MNTSSKSGATQAYQLLLYRKPLHPELFQLKNRKAIKLDGGEVEAWLMAGSHVARCQIGPICACELVTDREDGLPTAGAVAQFPCAGEKDYEHEFADGELTYVATVQTETLNDALYNSTYKDMIDYAADLGAMAYKWTMPGVQLGRGRCLSVLELQRFDDQAHVSSFHLIADGGLVLRTQTIFERL